jgi:hypothetical protein
MNRYDLTDGEVYRIETPVSQLTLFRKDRRYQLVTPRRGWGVGQKEVVFITQILK